MTNEELCASFSILFLNFSIVGTHKRPWYNNPPSDDLEYTPAGYVSISLSTLAKPGSYLSLNYSLLKSELSSQLS